MSAAAGWRRWLARLYGRVPILATWAARKWPTVGGGPLPWAPARVPLKRASIALVTSAGVHLVSQPPFDMANPDGDASYRIIPGNVAPGDLVITHDYYDHRAADRDLNCVFPLERLHALAREGLVGSVAPRHVGTMGHILGREEHRLLRETGPAIAELLRADRVDYVLATPG